MTTRLRHAAAPDGTYLCNRGYAGALADPPTCPTCRLIRSGSVLAVDAATRAKVSYRQLDHWVRLGLIHPDPIPPGSGQRRTLPAREVVVTEALAALANCGLSLPVAHALARASPEDAHRIAASIAAALHQREDRM